MKTLIIIHVGDVDCFFHNPFSIIFTLLQITPTSLSSKHALYSSAVCLPLDRYNELMIIRHWFEKEMRLEER